MINELLKDMMDSESNRLDKMSVASSNVFKKIINKN
jgi:hypothetical protein